MGKIPALIVFLLDVGKGTAAIMLSKAFLLDQNWQVIAGLAAITGHIWPIWLKGKGGKAVATGLGIFLGISWKVGLGSLGIFLMILSIWKIVSLSSICAAISLPIIMAFTLGDNLSFSYMLLIIKSLIPFGLDGIFLALILYVIDFYHTHNDPLDNLPYLILFLHVFHMKLFF